MRHIKIDRPRIVKQSESKTEHKAPESPVSFSVRNDSEPASETQPVVTGAVVVATKRVLDDKFLAKFKPGTYVFW